MAAAAGVLSGPLFRQAEARAAAGGLELRARRARELREARPVGGGDGRRLGRLGDRERIVVHAVDAELEVQVRAGGPARGADRADALALLDALALAHVDAAQVGVGRGARAVVLDLHHVAVAVLHAGELDHAVADGAYRRAGGRGVVDAEVAAPFLQDRMHAQREAGGDARERERAGEEGALLALAVEAEVAAPGGAAAL